MSYETASTLTLLGHAVRDVRLASLTLQRVTAGAPQVHGNLQVTLQALKRATHSVEELIRHEQHAAAVAPAVEGIAE